MTELKDMRVEEILALIATHIISIDAQLFEVAKLLRKKKTAKKAKPT